MPLLKLPPLQFEYQKADKLYFYDKFMALTVLRLIPNWIKPNHITLLRFLSIPVVAYLAFYGHDQIGLIAFLASAFTDMIDGSMARNRNQITEWGKIYDPIADKMLIACMVYIIVLKYIDPWAAYLIVFLEILIVLVGWYRLRKGYRVQANRWGKIKMVLQVFGVAVLQLSIVFNLASILPLASGALYLAIAFAIVSLLTYGI